MAHLKRWIERLSGWLAGRPSGARTTVIATIVVSWVAAVLLAWFTWDLLSSIPDRDTLRRVGDMAQATTLLDRQDRAVFTIFTEQRIEVPLAQISPLLVKAIVSIEDQRFYDHQGVDTVRIAAAALTNLREGRRAQGGSTLTQQLARQAFLTLDKSYVRKLKEVIVAAELEAEYSKDEILELYLNKVYFGDGLHGVEAASLGFFGKHASDLTLAEAALIAGLVKSPSAYAPTVNLKRAITRRDLVLQTMVGSGVITAAEADQAKAQPVQLKSTLGRDDPHGAWFKEEVRRQLIARFGLDRVYQGGLKVYTTVDMAMQQAAELLVEDALIEVENRRAAGRKKGAPADDTPLEGALVALDPHTGHVRALVGGRSFESSQFNRAIQAKRQPGSAFKPFVFAAALEQGWSPASVIDRLDEPIQTLQGAWMPEDEHATTPSMTLRTALRTSSNRAAVRLLEEVGIPPTVEYAKRLGVGLVPSVPSLALGSGEVTLEGMTAAYATFASAGVHRTPVVIRRVEDRDGQVIYEAPDDADAGRVGDDRVSAVEHAQRRRQLRHRLEGAPRGLHAAGRRQDRDDQRLRRCLVCRLHAEAGGRRVDWLRPAQDDHRRRLRRRHRGAAVGPVHEGGDQGRSARVVHDAQGPGRRGGVPRLGHAARRRLLRRRSGQRRRRGVAPIDGDHRLLPAGQGALRGLPAPPGAATCWRPWRAGSGRTAPSRSPPRSWACRPSRRRVWRPRRLPRPTLARRRPVEPPPRSRRRRSAGSGRGSSARTRQPTAPPRDAPAPK